MSPSCPPSSSVPPPAVDIVIVNYCTGSLVIAALESLEAERKYLPGLRAIVVDNNSPDGSGALIEAAVRQRGWDWVRMMSAGANGGFGAGNNLAIDWALSQPEPADLFWLLNPDTLVYSQAGIELARFMQSHPKAGIAGSALLEGDGRLWPFAFRFPSILGEIERGARWGFVSRLLRKKATLLRMGDRNERVDWVSGASFMIRRSLLETGLRFDEGYFLYYEETDFCLSAHRLGWECWYVPGARVLHVAGQSTGVTGRQVRLRRLPSYWFHSRRRYFTKNHGWTYGLLADLGWLGAHLFATVKRLAFGRPDPDPPRLLRDFMLHSVLMLRR
ncbi:MAG: glycosyltransferase family 2 protein [Sphingobium sp.]